ncbi:hypothetical protein NDU88_006643 [Pleurodeles waltl]|uniref:Uncharacterized protein n=1 Tax=Pleurodeles waltl TaxID=8319 RepID=A0AAV7MZV3_PLEWA|nr:hypothetical protein NDU88_006643 [Pleurodeles waltl]
MTGHERARSTGVMNTDSAAASKDMKDVIQVAKERRSFTPSPLGGAEKAKEVMGARGPRGIGLGWGKAALTKEYVGSAPVCEADSMEVDYFEDSPEEGETGGRTGGSAGWC